MSLNNALDSAISGLNLNQKKMYLSSFNVAHAGDKDFYRLESELCNDRLGDVSIKRVKVVMDKIIEENRIEQNAVVGYSKIKDFFLERVSDAFGSPLLPEHFHDEIIPKNISTAIEDFFDKINMLSGAPENSALKHAVVNSAHHLSHIMHHTASTLQNLRLQADEMISTTCLQINQDIKEVHQINYELLYLETNNDRKAHLELSRRQAIQRLSEYIDIVTQTEKNGSIYIYTNNGQPLLEDQPIAIQHESTHSLEDVLANKKFSPISVKSEFYQQELSASQIVSGKIKGLLEIRDHDTREILSHIDRLAMKISAEVNNIYSAGNHFPGHQYLSSSHEIEDVDFTGAVKFILLNEDGDTATIGNNYPIRPLKVDLEGKNLQQITQEINQHYSFGSQKVKIADKIDDVKLMPKLQDDDVFEFSLQMENAKGHSRISIEKISIMYDDDSKVLSTENPNININADPYEIINTPDRLGLKIGKLPSVIQEFTVRIEINVDGISTDIDYIIDQNQIQDHYSATNVIGRDSQIIATEQKQYMEAEYKNGIFSMKANENLRLVIEDINSNSVNGKFFHALQCNNLFVESSDNNAFNFKVHNTLKESPETFNVATPNYNKDGLPRIAVSNNTTVKKILALSNQNLDFNKSKQFTFYSFATFIIESTAFKSHDARIVKEHELSFQEALDDEQKKISGVNIDEEIANSMFLKNWHEALTNIVQLVDKMFADLVNII